MPDDGDVDATVDVAFFFGFFVVDGVVAVLDEGFVVSDDEAVATVDVVKDGLTRASLFRLFPFTKLLPVISLRTYEVSSLAEPSMDAATTKFSLKDTEEWRSLLSDQPHFVPTTSLSMAVP